MRKFIITYYQKLKNNIDAIATTDYNGKLIDFPAGVEIAAQLIIERTSIGNKLMFIGNGASAAISSHMSTDFWKNGGMRAVAFNDSSLLTCIGNDYGYEFLFEKPVEMFAESGDILIAISSSGSSVNILNGADAARKKECRIITFSGFRADNTLRNLGDINFYVPADEYGPVEILHHSICHCILDCIVNKKKDLFNE